MFLEVSRFSSPVSLIGLGGFSPGSHSRFPFQVFFKVPLQQIPRLAELASEKGGNCNNVTFGAESSRSIGHVTTIIQDFTLVNLTSINPRVLLKPRHWVGSTVPFHLHHWAGGTSTYKSEGYSVARVSGMKRDDKGEQEWWQRPRRIMMNVV